MITGYLSDAFDLLNVRDLDVISQARSQCDRLLIGVYTDEYAEHITGRRPVVPLKERLALLAHVRGVDGVEVHDPSLSLNASDTRVFTVDDGAAPENPNGVVLRPRRRTQGPILRQALAPLSREEPAA